jgi:prophage regulatory protein
MEMPTMLRIKDTLDATGQKSPSGHYVAIKKGLFTRGVSITGSRSVGWPRSEVVALIQARIRGASETEIKALVDKLHAERRTIGAV